MIKLFGATDKLYSNNGDLVLQTIKAKVHKEDNGDFYINVEAPLSENEKSLPALAGTTVTGKNFTLNNVDRFKEVEITNIDGDTSQSGTPTPSTPQPINVVSGRQDIEVCKKNLYDTSKSVNGYVNNSGAVVLDYKNLLTDYIKLTSGSKYTISVNTTFGNIGYAYFDSNKTYVSRQNNNNKQSITLTIPNNVNYIRIWFNKDGATDMTPENILQYQPMVELGESRTTYEVYNGNTYEINLGKNLFNTLIDKNAGYTSEKNGITQLYNDNGSITLSGTATAQTDLYITNASYGSTTNNFILDNNTSYTLSLVGNTNTNIQILIGYGSSAKNTSTSRTDTYTTNISWAFIRIANGTDLTTPLTIYPQLEKGNATDYAPYKTPIELCKINDYKDRIYKDSGKWYIEKNIGKVVLNGSENWTAGVYDTNSWDLNNIIDTTWNTNELQVMSSVFKGVAHKDRATSGNNIMYSIANKNIEIRNTTLTTQAQVQSATNGTPIYYVLKTPTTTEITDLELINQLNSLKLLEGLNNISITSADLVGTYTIHYNYREAQSTKINYIDYLVPNNIIVANTPQGDQAFRITNVENTRSKIKIKAYHVFYDSENYLIKDTFIVDKNCNDALDQLNNNTDNISPFTTISDITKIASYRCVRKSLYEAIQVLLERYGGHLVRDNWNIGIRANIGQDNGVTIRYGKNLKDIKATYNWDSVCTKLLPVGKDGLLLNALDPTASVYLESATQYEIPYTKSVNFDQNDISEEDYKDEETGEVDEEAYTQALINDLAEKGQNYLQNNSTPVVNYTLNANVEKVSDIGDTIQVIDEKLGISLLTNIISYEYDCILDKYTQIEFGNFTPTLSGLMGSINNQIQQTVDESTATLQITLGQELQEAQDKIWNALGSSYVIYEGDKILVVDSLPKETATNVIMINNGGIGFSNNGINGTFNSAWTIDNILNMEQINVINLTADLIKGGTLKLGNNLNQNGQLEVYDEANSLIAQLNKDGLKMYGVDGSYILMNNTVGFSGYDRLGNQIYWVSKDEFHQKKSVVEEEITLCNKLRFIPITITDGNNNIVNDGIGLVSVAGGGN